MPLQDIDPPNQPFFTTAINSSGNYEDECDYVFNDDASVHGSWNAVGTLEKRDLNYFTKGRTEYITRIIDTMLLQTVTLSAEGRSSVNSGSSAMWTKDYFIMKYNDTQLVGELIYAKVNGTEYILIEDKTSGYLKTGKTDKYFVFMNANSRKIIYTTVLCDDGHYDDVCDYVFYDDPSVHGTWKFEGQIGKDQYDKWIAGVLAPYYTYYESGTKELIFNPDGTTKNVFNTGKYFPDIWTNGYFLHESGDGKTIEEYFIVNRNGKDYLLLEHKSGEYSRGKEVTIYNVFTRKDS